MSSARALEFEVAERLMAQGRTLAVAESCTGGLICHRLTEVPGISGCLLGGVVAYSNTAKRTLLGVPEEVLLRWGAVSAQAATRMARGVRLVFSSDWGLSVTGICGPSGGTPEKPVGMTFVGLSGPAGDSHREYRFQGTRSRIKRQASLESLRFLLDAIQLPAT